MTTRLRTGGTSKINVCIPTEILAALDTHLSNPRTGNLPYGARSECITDLIKAYLKEKEK